MINPRFILWSQSTKIGDNSYQFSNEYYSGVFTTTPDFIHYGRLTSLIGVSRIVVFNREMDIVCNFVQPEDCVWRVSEHDENTGERVYKLYKTYEDAIASFPRYFVREIWDAPKAFTHEKWFDVYERTSAKYIKRIHFGMPL
jgi:hypothetical protein